jgi:hypothetical protein
MKATPRPLPGGVFRVHAPGVNHSGVGVAADDLTDDEECETLPEWKIDRADSFPDVFLTFGIPWQP